MASAWSLLVQLRVHEMPSYYDWIPGNGLSIEAPDLLDDESALGAVVRLQEHPPSILFLGKRTASKTGNYRTARVAIQLEQRSSRSHSQCHRAVSANPLFLVYSTLGSRNSVRCRHSAVSKIADVLYGCLPE